jgi:hypothetical protein
VKELAALADLKRLLLSDTKVTDKGLNELAAVKSLKSLILTNTKTTEAGVAKLKKALPDCEVSR